MKARIYDMLDMYTPPEAILWRCSGWSPDGSGHQASEMGCMFGYAPWFFSEPEAIDNPASWTSAGTKLLLIMGQSFFDWSEPYNMLGQTPETPDVTTLQSINTTGVIFHIYDEATGTYHRYETDRSKLN